MYGVTCLQVSTIYDSHYIQLEESMVCPRYVGLLNTLTFSHFTPTNSKMLFVLEEKVQ